jgi:hypothetical protein
MACAASLPDLSPGGGQRFGFCPIKTAVVHSSRDSDPYDTPRSRSDLLLLPLRQRGRLLALLNAAVVAFVAFDLAWATAFSAIHRFEPVWNPKKGPENMTQFFRLRREASSSMIECGKMHAPLRKVFKNFSRAGSRNVPPVIHLPSSSKRPAFSECYS